MKYYFLFTLLVIFIISLFLLISDSYRLGDAILTKGYSNSFITRKFYNIYFKESIATEYLNETNKIKDFDTLHQIVKKRSLSLNSFPKEDELIIHLRIGDVIDHIFKGSVDDILEEKSKFTYLISYKYLENNLKKIKNIKKIIITGGFHKKGDHSRSIEYVNKIIYFLEKKNYTVIKKLNISSPDEDFIWMCNSKNFLKSGGGFSNLINKMVQMNGGNILEKCNFEENLEKIKK